MRLHELFALDWDYNNIEYPESATYSGYKGQNGRWTELSLEAIAARKKELESPLAAIKSIDRASLSKGDQLNYDLFRRGAEDAIAGTRFPSEYLAIDARSGPQLLSEIIRAESERDGKGLRGHRFASRWARRGDRPDDRAARQGLKARDHAPRMTLRDVPAQVESLLPGDPLKSPVLETVPALPVDDPAGRAGAAARPQRWQSFTQQVAPAFRKLHGYLAKTYIPGARETIAMATCPTARPGTPTTCAMHTTTDLTPEQIHQIGLSEVKRIRGEMDSVIAVDRLQGELRGVLELPAHRSALLLRQAGGPAARLPRHRQADRSRADQAVRQAAAPALRRDPDPDVQREVADHRLLRAGLARRRPARASSTSTPTT